MSRTKKRIKSTSCPNCHEVFADVNHNFCPFCGQENHTHKLPVQHFVMETVESVTSFDTKFLNTLKDLVLKPGLVIKNYNANKRTRYVPPMRMYVFTTFIFFLIYSLLFDSKIEEINGDFKQTLTQPVRGQIQFFTKTPIDVLTQKQLQNLKPVTTEKVEALLKSKKIATDWINTRLLTSITKLQTGELKVSDLNQKVIKYSSYSLFLFMPFFAFILKLFYRRGDYFYSEFLVFSIFFHIFLFGILAITLITQSITNSKLEYFAIPFMSAGIVYLGLSLRIVFEGSWLKTITKTFFLTCIYAFCIMMLLFFLVLGSMM